MPTPEISVIVPVRDASWDEDARGLLAALDAQEGAPAFEVLLVDDGSDRELPADLRLRAGELRIVRAPAQGAYAARNTGLREARGSTIAFTDADCRPHPAWLAAGAAAAEDHAVAAGPVRIRLSERPTLWAAADAATFLDQSAAVRHGGAVTANLFVAAPLLTAIGGFRDTDLPSGGDYDLVQRLGAAGHPVVLAERAVVDHPSRDTARSFWQKVWVSADCSGRLAARHGSRPRAASPKAWIPVVGRLRHRRREGLPLAFHHGREELVATRPGPLRHTAGALVTYLAVPYVVNAGVLHGMRAERRGGPAAPPPRAYAPAPRPLPRRT